MFLLLIFKNESILNHSQHAYAPKPEVVIIIGFCEDVPCVLMLASNDQNLPFEFGVANQIPKSCMYHIHPKWWSTNAAFTKAAKFSFSLCYSCSFLSLFHSCPFDDYDWRWSTESVLIYCHCQNWLLFRCNVQQRQALNQCISPHTSSTYGSFFILFLNVPSTYIIAYKSLIVFVFQRILQCLAHQTYTHTHTHTHKQNIHLHFNAFVGLNYSEDWPLSKQFSDAILINYTLITHRYIKYIKCAFLLLSNCSQIKKVSLAPLLETLCISSQTI